MDNKRVYLIDFNCVVDVNGNPMGHTLGVAQLLYNILKDINSDIVYVSSPEYAKHFNNVACMPILTSLVRGGGRVDEKQIIRNNFDIISKQINKGVLFFTHCDPYYAHLLPKNNRHRKSIAVFYSTVKSNGNYGLIKRILLRMFNKYRISCIANRISVVIKTNKQLRFPNKNTLYMPDYYYLPEKFSQYKYTKQDDKVVCLGQNNKYKKIIPLIAKFKNSKYKLVIRGKFFDDAVYKEALKLSEDCDNIFIENNNISEDEYYKELATSEYCILPYDKEFYFERTTGIGIEAMFLDSVVIGPKEILKFNDIAGIGYDSLEDLDLESLDKDHSETLHTYKLKRDEEYSESATKNVVEQALSVAILQLKN